LFKPKTACEQDIHPITQAHRIAAHDWPNPLDSGHDWRAIGAH